MEGGRRMKSVTGFKSIGYVLESLVEKETNGAYLR